MNRQIETASEITITVKDVQDLATELAAYSQLYRDLFGRREQKEQYELYLQGLMTTLLNKSVETMMLNLKGDNPQAIRQRHWEEVNQDLGDENGVLIVDSSGFPKQRKGIGWCQRKAAKAIDIVNYYQRRHEAAYRSHRKRRPSKYHKTEVSLQY